MKKTFEKHETLFTIALIIIYVVANSDILQNFESTSYQSVIINNVLSILVIVLMILLKRVKFYGITKVNNLKNYLYFIPLLIISLFNLRSGFRIDNTTNEIIYYVLTMINVGFLEEIIFRGFLFKMMEKDNVNCAIVVSSITFGVGHIVNLLNGADLIPTLMQVCYATAIGYMLVSIFYKCKSLVPCIIFHIIFNSLSIFSNFNFNSPYYKLSIVLLIAMCLGYAIYINKKVKE